MTKYVFKLPQHLLEANTEKRMIVSHRLFLTATQRKSLQTEGTMVETTGVSCPIWIEREETTEPAQEVFCRYQVVAGVPVGDHRIVPDDKGYTIYLVDQARRLSLADIKDGGVAWLNFVLPETISVGDKTRPVIHQVVISGIEELDRSMFAVHLPQTSSS